MTQISGDSPQAVALQLLEHIAMSERKTLGIPGSTADKEWILTTYKECLEVVLTFKRWGAYGTT